MVCLRSCLGDPLKILCLGVPKLWGARQRYEPAVREYENTRTDADTFKTFKLPLLYCVLDGRIL